MTIGSPRAYAIGFVKPDQPRAASLGSGTLVSFGIRYAECSQQPTSSMS